MFHRLSNAVHNTDRVRSPRPALRSNVDGVLTVDPTMLYGSWPESTAFPSIADEYGLTHMVLFVRLDRMALISSTTGI